MKSQGLMTIAVLSALAHVACGDDTGSGGAGGEGGNPPGTTKTSTSSPSSTSPSSTGTTSQASTTTGTSMIAPQEDWTRDVKSYDLAIDLENLTGTATIVLADADSEGASFEIGDLVINSVSDQNGELLFESVPGTAPNPQQLNIGVPNIDGDTTLVITYDFVAHEAFDGWMASSGLTFLWPYFCGNLFPCKSDTTDGASFALALAGLPAGQVAVYPDAISADAPTYMPAVAIGDYTKLDLGTTTDGTAVSVWHLPGQAAAATAGTTNLVDVVDFFEQTYGPYAFGDEVGTVEANWGPGAYGGMEHHPYWHVASDALGSEEVNAHEAAHGWFGNGVRIDCWEDFVLSEGTATYLAARALAESGVDLWPDYECGLKSVCEGAANTIVYPATCDAIDIFNDPLWSYTPYMKGAFFWKTVSEILGEDALDQVFSDFYQANVGQAANLQDLIDAAKAGATPEQVTQIETAETDWLHTLACPVDTGPLCP